MRTLRQLSGSLVAILVATAATAVLLRVLGASPIEVGRVVWEQSFGSVEAVAYVLFYATPLIFTGLAVALAFRAGLFNIGAEGQLYVAAFAAAAVAAHGAGLPWWLITGGATGGALAAAAVWAAVPGLLRVYRGAHEVITTIMLNFIALGLTTYWATHTFREPGQSIPRTVAIVEGARVARIETWVLRLGALAERFEWNGLAAWCGNTADQLGGHVPLNTMFLVALGACLFLAWALRYTVWGFEVDVVGENPAAAAAAGLRVRRTIVIAMALSGTLAAGAGLNEVLGHSHRFTYAFSNGLGFLGIAVALLGRNRPLGVLGAGLLFGVLVRGGLFLDLFTERVDKDVVFVLQGLLIWCVGIGAAAGRGIGARWGSGAVRG